MGETNRINGSIIIEDTQNSDGGIIRNITATDVVTLKQKDITVNGTYVAKNEQADGYSQINVNVNDFTLTGSLSTNYTEGELTPLYTLSGEVASMPAYTLSGEVVVPDVVESETFDGDYIYTPIWDLQEIPTAHKLLTSDIQIESIPLYEVSNEHGGITLSI